MVEVFHVLPNFFPNTLDVIKHLDISILTPLNSDNKSTTSLRTFCTQFFPCDAVEFEKLGPITCCYLKLSKIAMDFTSTSLWASILFSVHPLPYLRQDPIFGLVLNSTGTSEIIYVVHNVSSTEQIEESFRRVDLPTSFPCIDSLMSCVWFLGYRANSLIWILMWLILILCNFISHLFSCIPNICLWHFFHISNYV